MKKIVAILIASLVMLAVSCGGGAGVKVAEDLGVVMPTVMFGEPYMDEHISSELQFGKPKPVGVNSKGNIVVGGKDFNLSMYTADGAYIMDIGSKGEGEGQWKYTKGLGITANDEIVVCDSILMKVLIYDAEGKFVKEFTHELLEDFGPMAVADGKIYCSDDVNGVLEFDMDGNYIRTVVAKTDGGQTMDFGYIAVDKANNKLYIADDGNGEVDIYSLADGAYSMTLGGLGPEIYQWAEDIEGLAIGPDGMLIAVDEAANERGAIKIFDKDGKFITAFGKAGIYDGEFASTEGAAFDFVNNRIVISDEKNNRIQCFSLESLGL